MGRRTFHVSLVVGLLVAMATVADARGMGGGGGGGGGGRRRAAKGAKGATQTAAILDGTIRRDNLRRARQIDW